MPRFDLTARVLIHGMTKFRWKMFASVRPDFRSRRSVRPGRNDADLLQALQIMSVPDGEQDGMRGPSRQKTPQLARLPGWGILLVAGVSLIYGWWQNGNQPPPPVVRAPVGAVDTEEPTEPEINVGDSSDEKSPEVATASEESEATPNSNRTSRDETVTGAARGQTTGDGGAGRQRAERSPQAKPQPPPAANTERVGSPTKSRTEPAAQRSPTLIPQVTLKNQDGRTIYQGPIDLQPTIDRITNGERNRHRNDGTVFQNREGRLARKPSGYYHEYVVPTPNQNGPGPQRLILGEEGEVFYTADHYRTFRKIAVKIRVPAGASDR